MTLAPDMEDYLLEQIPDNCNPKIYTELLTEDNLEKDTEILGVFTDSKVSSKVFEKLPNLKQIVTLATGFDNVDLNEAKKRNVPVCNVPAYGDDTVAEYTVGLIISLIRNINKSIDKVSEGEFNCHGLRGLDLKDKKIGIIGTGHIGEKVIKKLSSFEVDFLAFDPYPKDKLKQEYSLKYVKKDKLLQNSDIVTLHAPLLESTHHTIDKKAIKNMKEGAFIINTARGGLIDSKALLDGLQQEKIAGAALDVLEEENILSEPETICNTNYNKNKLETSIVSKILIDHPNTIVTPHNAFNSIGAIKRIINTTCDNIKNFTQGNIQNDVTQK